MERLKELRNENGISQTKLAEDLGVTQVCICKYESGQREPDIATIIKISKYFKVSTDYLLGVEEY